MPTSRAARSAFVAPLLAAVLLAACGESLPDPVERDLPAIAERDTLVALVTFNSTGYFVYRGQPMGFEYDLLRHFAKSRDMALRAVVVEDRAELFRMLNEGEGDVVAARLFRTVADSGDVTFTRPLYESRPAVIQRTGPPSEVALRGPGDTILPLAPPDSVAERAERAPEQIRARLITSKEQLVGESITLPASSSVRERLLELEDEIGGDIQLVEVEDARSYETIIRDLATGEVRLTAAPEELAQLKAEHYTNLTVVPTIEPPLEVVWAVRKNAPQLQAALNDWIAQEREGLVEAAYQTYFHDREGFRERMASEYLSTETGRLSAYDTLFKARAPELGWDWRLLASQAYQESKFDPRARSWAGAMGILQLMPGTAREVDVSNPYDPEENVEGAVRYLLKMRDRWQGEVPEEDQIKFMLASYNTGAGHVQDAQRLAEKHGDDPTSWEDVAFWLLKKS